VTALGGKPELHNQRQPGRSPTVWLNTSELINTIQTSAIGKNVMPGTPSVLFFLATLPLKPAIQFPAKIGHLAFQVDLFLSKIPCSFGGERIC